MDKRWTVTVHLKPLGVELVGKVIVWFIEDISELDQLIEAGPSWHIVDRYVITYNLGGTNGFLHGPKQVSQDQPSYH